jgi:predicted transcriptional regulator
LVKTNADEDRFSDIHFQLSNADRRRIIEELQMQNLKLNEVAKKLDITATEAYRQLQRMTDSGLLEKASDGRYRSTPYARLILESTSAVHFLSKHREYFLAHDASLIPPQFRARFGELSRMVFLPDPITNLNATNEVLRNAEEWIDVMSEQRLEQHVQVLKQRESDGLKVRFVHQESLIESMKGELAASKQSVERRFLPVVCAAMVLTDKSAGFALRRLDGKMDYQVFAGTDPESMKWAHDLYEDHWNKAKPWHP